MYYFGLSILAGLSWGISTIIEKYYLLNYFKPIDILVIRSAFVALVFLVLIIKNQDNELINKIKNLQVNMSLKLLLNIIISSLGSFLFFLVLKQTKVTNTVGTIYSVGISSPIIISYLFYKEILSLYQVFGTLFIILGIYLVNFKK